jgi:hypothetical protein
MADMETLTVGMTGGLAAFLFKIGYEWVHAKLTKKVEIGPSPLKVEADIKGDGKAAYATKADLEKLRMEIEAKCAAEQKAASENFREIYNLLRDAEKRNGEWQRGIAEQIGRISAAVEAQQRGRATA